MLELIESGNSAAIGSEDVLHPIVQLAFGSEKLAQLLKAVEVFAGDRDRQLGGVRSTILEHKKMYKTLRNHRKDVLS